jgi:hypothetical protein
MKVYKEMGKEIPEHLFIPVPREDRSISPAITMRGFIDPRIDGVVTSYYEWYQGAQMDIKKTGGSMHKSESILTTLYFGFNKDNLFLRLDPAVPFAELSGDTKFSISFIKPAQFKIAVAVKPELKAELLQKNNGDWVQIRAISDVAVQDIFEIGIPFSDLNAKEKEEINFFVSILQNDEEIERHPWRGYISITVPTPDFEAMMWS